VRAGAKAVWYVSFVGQVRLQNVVEVGFDAMKKSSSAESNRSATVGTSAAQYPSCVMYGTTIVTESTMCPQVHRTGSGRKTPTDHFPHT